MKATAPLHQSIVEKTRDLPAELLQEVLDFVQFLRAKRLPKSSSAEAALKELDASEAAHLEEEFQDYDKLYPHE